MDIDFKKELKEQLDSLKTSCNLYDSGKLHEAVRIAGILRTIFNDGRHPSLLAHLKSKDIALLSTAHEFTHHKATADGPTIYITDIISSLIKIAINLADMKIRVIPLLNDSESRSLIPFMDWWGKEIILNKGTGEITRNKLILAAANAGGGAHVGKKLPDFFVSEVSITFTHEGYQTAIKSEGADFAWAVLRQIGYEVLNSKHLKKLTI